MKKIWRSFNISLFDLLAALVCIAVTCFYNVKLAAAEAALVVILLFLRIVYQKAVQNKLLFRMKAVSDELDYETGKALSVLTVACTVVDSEGSMIWFNDTFRDSFSITEKSPACDLKTLLKRESIDKLLEGRGFKIRVAQRYFAVYSSEVPIEGETLYLLYFFDETKLRLTEREFYDTRPSVLLAVLDNADELSQDFKESESAAIFSMLEQMVDDWAISYGSLCRKFASGRLLIITEERALQKMIADKFSILDRVRSFTYDGRQTDLTLSIGIGREACFSDSNDAARQALDMAQSRGGDQVAIRHEAQYQFYGGVSAGFESKNKAKTRLLAKTMAELIKESGNVIIMGHRFADYDAIGSAVGLYAICSHFGKKAAIAIERRQSLSEPLCKRVEESYGKQIFVSAQNALQQMDEQTLLFVVDTHKRDFTDCPPLLDAAGKIIVIDHHRKSVGFIENAVVFYHSPTASSAAEMVTEIAQYIDKQPILDAVAAQSLFAGIMLDTRNFVIRTGVRTFEAAAYLRSRAANTVEVKKLFSNDMDVFRKRNRIIDDAKRISDVFAVSFTEEQDANLRLITSQAADEMLNIEGIKASFVLFRLGEGVNISARSYGEVNVQVIMEALGGGGHQTMAACQLGPIEMSAAFEKLKEAIKRCSES